MAKANPFFDVDFSKILSEFKVPGVDVEAVLATQRKNIEALTAANQLAFEGVQTLVRRQTEILRQTLEQASQVLQEALGAGTPEEKVAKQAELVKAAFERALVNAKELTELVTKSNHEAAEVISNRVRESLEELKEQVTKHKK
ncbi:MAG: phasin family protein [Azospirillaceae bacterium]|nr:phasin family protein [Azospirillaceae bacterium]